MRCFDGNSINTIIQFNRSYFRVHDPFQCCNNYQRQLTFSRPPTHSFFRTLLAIDLGHIGLKQFLKKLTMLHTCVFTSYFFTYYWRDNQSFFFLNNLLKRRCIQIRMLHQIGSHLKYELACLRSCFIFTSFGTFCACCRVQLQYFKF